MNQRPNVFGLHGNTAIGYSARFAKDTWACLQRLLPETDSVTGIPTGDQMSSVSKETDKVVAELVKAAKAAAKSAEEATEGEGTEGGESATVKQEPPKEKKKKRRRKRPAHHDDHEEEGEEEDDEEEEEEGEEEEWDESWETTEESSMTTPMDDLDDVSFRFLAEVFLYFITF